MKKSQFIEVLNKVGSSINSGNKEYMVSYFNDAVETSCGLIISYKYNLKKTFCFGYYDYNNSFENAENMIMYIGRQNSGTNLKFQLSVFQMNEPNSIFQQIRNLLM